jgi:3',5'-cyclic AMP phosphodiesterase CpdA
MFEPLASCALAAGMTVVGNHEIEVDINLQTFEAYNARFLMPSINYGTAQQSRQLWYSYEIGPIHFLMLSSYSAYDSTSAQYAWLQADLKTIDRTKTPWVVCILHAPWYNTNTAHQGEGEAMRQSMESSLYNAGVDVVFAGHVHAYERSYRVYNNQLDPKGPYYITIGDGGNREGLAANWICALYPNSH